MNKFNIISDEIHVIDKEPINLHHKVKQRISNYLGFKADDLLEGTDACYFGGIVRDSIAEQDIHDADIMTLPKSANIIVERLISYGFKKTNFASIGITSIYNNHSVISEPLTFVYYDTIVQLIRPRFLDIEPEPMEKFNKLLSQVDISACGVSYSEGKIKERCKDAIQHCIDREFIVYNDHIFHHKDRIHCRIAKLENRGWENITPF